jgi:Tetratricopeptide repeat
VQYERALEISEAALGPDHPNLAVYRGDLAAVAAGLGKPGEDLSGHSWSLAHVMRADFQAA